MAGGRIILCGALLISGCVPAGAPRVSGKIQTKAYATPRIEPLMEGLLDEKPIWEAQPVTANAVVVSQGLYVVSVRDNLRAIGEATGVGSETLARANNLVPPYLLMPGQLLRVPAGRYHRVAPGETGIAIARAYGIPWNAFVAANGLQDPFVLRVGQRLRLPPTSSDTLEGRAAAFKVDIDDIATGGTPARVAPGNLPETVAVASPVRFAWPVLGTVGERFGPAGFGRINHGIEIAVSPGADIRAAADGTVAFVGNGGSAGYGGLILVRHGNGWISAYGRAATANVARGQLVKTGQVIGNTGDEVKLHFELRRDRVAVDPVEYLPRR